MNIPKYVITFFEQNKSKSKKEIIKDMIEIFNYKESTAALYYSHRNSNIKINNSNDNPNVKSKREMVLKFFEENQEAVNDSDNVKYANKLGVKVATYANYKMQYQNMVPVENYKLIEEPKEQFKCDTKFYKNRMRMKFEFDDSRLFG